MMETVQRSDEETYSCDDKSGSRLVDAFSKGSHRVWDKKVEGTRMEHFKSVINTKYGVKLETDLDLQKWSVENYEHFWEEIWLYFDVISSKPYKEVVKKGKKFFDTEWFPEARLNYAENLLRYRDDHIALLYAGYKSGERSLTYAQLYDEVKLYAAAFRKNGLKPGDIASYYAPNVPEAIIAMLAAVSIGAIWGGPVMLYGPQAARRMFEEINPTIILTVDQRGDDGEDYNVLEYLPYIVNGLKSVKFVIIVPMDEETMSKNISGIETGIFLEHFLETGKNKDGSVPELIFDQFPLSHPINLVYTSGTTGLPKGLIHSSAMLLPLLSFEGLHANLQREENVLSIFPVGWPLWNHKATVLALGATMVIYAGIQNKKSYWNVLDKYKISHTSLSPSLIDIMEKFGDIPGQDCTLDSLKTLLFTGGIAKLENFDYLFKCLKGEVFISSIYGTSEIFSGITGAYLNVPVYSGELQAPALGIDMKCLDEKGNSVVGQRGEVVIATPNPSLPIGIWNDQDNKKFEEIYFSKYPGVWCQHDEGWINPKTRGSIIIGRSDDILKPYGIKIGCSEIYNAISTFKELEDYICVRQDNSNGEQRIILFLKLREGGKLSEDLLDRIRIKITEEFTMYCVPDVILQVQDIPYNLSNKRMETLVKQIISTNEIPDVANIRNPDCLKNFCNIAELLNF